MAYRDIILGDNPFAYWRLGEGAGVVADNEEGTAAYDGTYVNTPTLGVAGAIGGDADTAVTFTAVATESITGTALGNLGSTFTEACVEFWVKTTTTTKMALLRFYGGAFWYIGLNEDKATNNVAGKIRFAIYDDDDGGGNKFIQMGLTDASIIHNGSWHHVVCSIHPASATGSIYVDADNKAVEYGLQQAFTPTNNFTASQFATNSATYINGTLDEIALYKTSLSQGQVTAHYTNTPFVPSSGWWHHRFIQSRGVA